MTVQTATSDVLYNGDGVSVTFPIPFYFQLNSQIHAYVDGNLVAPSSISGAGNPDGGSLTFSAPPPIGSGNVYIIRQTDFLQESDYPENSKFPAKSIEDNFDKLTMQDQELQGLSDRSIKFPPGEIAPDLPSPAERANKIYAFDDDGNPIFLSPNVAGGGIAQFITITDAGGYYASNNVEGALQEVGHDTNLTGNNLTPVPSWDDVPELGSSAINAPAQALLNRTAFLESSDGAGKVGFLQSGTGAVARSVQDKARETTSLSDFALIQQAFPASGAGKKVKFGALYDVTTQTGALSIGGSTVSVPYDKGLVGEGYGSKAVVDPAGTAAVLFAANTDGAGNWVSAYPGVLSCSFSGLYFDLRDAQANGYDPLIFEVGGSGSFRDIKVLGGTKGIKQVSQYIDLIHVDRIEFKDYGTTAPENYFVDLRWAGDGCLVNSVHASLNWDGADPTTAVRSKTLRMRYKVGSTVANGLNGDVLIEACDGIETFAQHSESGQWEIRGSSATLRNHNWWMHVSTAGDLDVAPLKLTNISGVGNIAPGVVTVEDCGWIYQQSFLGGYSTSRENIEIEASWLGHLNIRHCYRKHRLPGITAAMATKVGISTTDPIFNAYSHFASVESRRELGKWVIDGALPDMPLLTGGLSNSFSAANAGFGTWAAASGTYYYKAQFFADTKRLVGLTGANEVSLALTNGAGAARLVFELIQFRGMVRVYRGTSSGSYDMYVDVPLIAGSSLTDTGNDILGYAWASRTPGAVDSINSNRPISFSLRPGETSASSDAYGHADVLMGGTVAIPTAGSWRRGDMVVYGTPTVVGQYWSHVGFSRATDCTSASPAHTVNTDWLPIIREARMPVSNSASLSSLTAVENANAYFKTLGRQVYDSTSAKLLWASGGSAGATWKDAAGTVVYTPA